MASTNELYEVGCSVDNSVIEESGDDEDEEEVMYEDLLDSTDLLTAQLASAGPVGLAAAAAIASGKKRRRLHSFETNPSIRKRQQTRLLRKLCALMEEYIVRVGQQAVIVCCSPSKPPNQSSSFRVFGSQPLEGIVRGQKSNIINDIEKLLSQQKNFPENGRSDLFELPPLSVEGISTSLERMTQNRWSRTKFGMEIVFVGDKAQLRYFIPEMLKFATGKSKPGWGKPECRPCWWPDDVPWANVRSDVREEDVKKSVSWTLALRKIVRQCYEHHNRSDLLNDPSSNLDIRSVTTPSSSYRQDDGYHRDNHRSSVVVQQVTNPDGSIKLVQLDTSGICMSSKEAPSSGTHFVPFTGLPEPIVIKTEAKDDIQIPGLSSSDTACTSRKIIRLARKRPSESDVFLSLQAAPPDSTNITRATLFSSHVRTPVDHLNLQEKIN